MHSRIFFLLSLGLCWGGAPAWSLSPDVREEQGDARQLIRWLLEDERDLSGVRFAEVVEATAGRKVLTFNPESGADRRLLQAVRKAMEELLAEVNRPEHAIHQVGRINEVSGHLEDLLAEKLNQIDGVSATLPPTAAGRLQRSGYPDIRLEDLATGRVFYLDPKLHAAGSEQSSFRTFYFEPKVETNKILDDATHLIIGVAHGGRQEGRWRFLHWNAVDLADFRVRLKAEFQASNRDLYRPEAIVAEGEAVAH